MKALINKTHQTHSTKKHWPTNLWTKQLAGSVVQSCFSSRHARLAYDYFIFMVGYCRSLIGNCVHLLTRRAMIIMLVTRHVLMCVCCPYRLCLWWFDLAHGCVYYLTRPTMLIMCSICPRHVLTQVMFRLYCVWPCELLTLGNTKINGFCWLL